MPHYMMISADSHVSEPPNLWVDWVDSKDSYKITRGNVSKLYGFDL